MAPMLVPAPVIRNAIAGPVAHAAVHQPGDERQAALRC